MEQLRKEPSPAPLRPEIIDTPDSHGRLPLADCARVDNCTGQLSRPDCAFGTRPLRHLHLPAWQKNGLNRGIRAWIRSRPFVGDPAFICVRSAHPSGEAADDAERAAIASLRTEFGNSLLDLGPE